MWTLLRTKGEKTVLLLSDSEKEKLDDVLEDVKNAFIQSKELRSMDYFSFLGGDHIRWKELEDEEVCYKIIEAKEL